MARRKKGYVCEQDAPKESTLPATVRLALLSGLIWGWLLIAMGQTAIAGAGSDASPAMLSFSWQIAFIALLAISLPLAKKAAPLPRCSPPSRSALQLRRSWLPSPSFLPASSSNTLFFAKCSWARPAPRSSASGRAWPDPLRPGADPSKCFARE